MEEIKKTYKKEICPFCKHKNCNNLKIKKEQKILQIAKYKFIKTVYYSCINNI